MTAETDADAGEDEHIKALFAEVDTNKDGKVVLFVALVLRFDCDRLLDLLCFLFSGAQRDAALIVWGLSLSSTRVQISFEEYLGESEADPAGAADAKPAAADAKPAAA